MADDPQQIWDDYYERIRRRRIREIQVVHAQMVNSGFSDSTVVALDFRHFGSEEACIRRLSAQLSEHYTMTISRSKSDDNYWLLDGTTRPEGVDGMNEQCCVEWVSFMCDVAQSHNCVFSTWHLTDPLMPQTWSNEKCDVDPEVESE